MKTYLLDSFNKYTRFSQKLDAQTVLCNKSWQVFNDSGEKETYIFKEDGSIIISVSGSVTFGKWSYEPANQSIILTGNEKSYMVKPAFLDDNILALQVDGTNNYVFMIDEVKKNYFQPRTYTELIQYFEAKERMALEEEEVRKRRILEYQQKSKEKQNDVPQAKEPPHVAHTSGGGMILFVAFVIVLILILLCGG